MSTQPSAPRLEDQLRAAIRVRDDSLATERSYVYWFRGFVRFHHRQPPLAVGPAGVRRFLDDLAVSRNVAPATQHQALCALLFLYRHVVGTELGNISDFRRSRRKPRLPVVRSRQEVARLLAEVTGIEGLVLRLLYGAGLRLHEALRLRVKDMTFAVAVAYEAPWPRWIEVDEAVVGMTITGHATANRRPRFLRRRGVAVPGGPP